MEAATDEDKIAVNWAAVLPQDVQRQLNSKSTIKKVQLIVSLILFLELPFAPLLWYIFESEDSAVKQRAGTFLRTSGNTQRDSDVHFPPRKLFNLWHTWFAFCRNSLHEFLVKPCALRITEAESNEGTNAADLRIKLSQLTMKDVREVLHPGRLLERYWELFPFTFRLLLAFLSSKNRYRRYNMAHGEAANEQADDDGHGSPGDTRKQQEQDGDDWDDNGLEDDKALDDNGL